MQNGAESYEEVACGVDEAGRGPVIGPLVVALVCGSNKALQNIGARDSKTLSPASRERLFFDIQKIASEVSYRIIPPDEINRRMDSQSLNEIEEDTYASLIVNSSGRERVYVDSFDVLPERLQHKLSSITKREVICRHHADSMFPVVSAASIVAKVIRDSEIRKLSEKYGNFGSGYPSDPRTVRFLTEALRNGLDISGIVRKHWSTYRRILSQVQSGKLF